MYNNYESLIKKQKRKYIIDILLLLPMLVVIWLFSKVDSQLITFILVPFILGTIFLIFMARSLYLLVKIISYNKNISFHDEELLDKELSNVLATSSGEVIFTENYVIVLKPTFRYISYRDIVLTYNTTGLVLDVASFQSSYTMNICGFQLVPKICIVMNEGKVYKLGVDKCTSFDSSKSFTFREIIVSKHPSVLLGKTVENKNIMQAKYGIKL